MKINRKNIWKIILIVIFVAVFLTTATNTYLAILINFSYISLLILTFFIFVIVDYLKITKFKNNVLKIIGTSAFAIIIGIFTINFQKKLNKKRVENLIVKLENYKKIYGKYPEKKQIELPKIISGLYISEVDYHYNKLFEKGYYIRYFDDFWQYIVYRSDTKEWYIDD